MGQTMLRLVDPSVILVVVVFWLVWLGILLILLRGIGDSRWWTTALSWSRVRLCGGEEMGGLALYIPVQFPRI